MCCDCTRGTIRRENALPSPQPSPFRERVVYLRSSFPTQFRRLTPMGRTPSGSPVEHGRRNPTRQLRFWLWVRPAPSGRSQRRVFPGPANHSVTSEAPTRRPCSSCCPGVGSLWLGVMALPPGPPERQPALEMTASWSAPRQPTESPQPPRARRARPGRPPRFPRRGGPEPTRSAGQWSRLVSRADLRSACCRPG